ncbi:hypothetical protein AS033_09740 [Exiguobacterium indicum]|uniref:Uncharacterized protein n=1 Tax=Exiguobacterium indicum TaxID=296995 RepID=A0A0V8GH91_9BACL|nr:hypothetical protein [Exiguobacterium enclense]KSU49628.1 hypothetical protein AS033_09740 [Exiguobacterium enclense]SDC68834.1 hypothetical protein SAMN05216342_1984 [Exiguobacterium enclense]
MNKNQIMDSGWNRQIIWQGCILASIAHAIFVANNPDFAYEQSWDGDHYSTNDGQGCRGTVTFGQDFFVAGFRNEEFFEETIEANDLLIEAPEKVQKIAVDDTFQYLLDDIEGVILPVVTTVLWGDDRQSFSSHQYEEMMDRGSSLFEIQASGYEAGLAYWEEYYELTERQLVLLETLYHLKIENPSQVITLSHEDIQVLDAIDMEGIEESTTSFYEIDIHWSSDVSN